MSPVLAGLLPLIILATPAVLALTAWTAFTFWMLARIARGDFPEPEQEEED